MPTISRFYGIVIAMYFGDHPPPHFHAWYAGHKGRIAIETGEPIDGDLPPRATRLIREWCEIRRDALEEIGDGSRRNSRSCPWSRFRDGPRHRRRNP